MRKHLRLGVGGLLLAAGATTVVWAGFDWVQDCMIDAGSLPATAQVVAAPGPVGSIRGCLGTGAAAGPEDFEDMYLINIVDPVVFSAQTLADETPFNPQLFLFDAGGLGLLANDDISDKDVQARLLPNSNDGTGVVINAPGLYLLAISGFDNDPLAPGGPIFNQADPVEISGPDGPGGAQPINAWNNAGMPPETGPYTIILSGVAGVPDPTGVPSYSTWSLAIMGVVVSAAAVVLLRRSV